MDSVVNVSLVLDRPLYQRLCRAADEERRSAAWIIDQALRRWLDARDAAADQPLSGP
jgi:predicted transcriptional regulator